MGKIRGHTGAVGLFVVIPGAIHPSLIGRGERIGYCDSTEETLI